MLYPTLNQPIVMLVMFFVGFASGFLFDFAFLLKKSLKDLKATNIFFDFLACIFSFVIFFVTNLYINYGQFRIYVVVVFIFACLLQRVLSNQIMQFFKKIVAKTKKKKL